MFEQVWKRIVLLVGVLACVCMLGATSASALPEWGKCEPAANGHYSDAGCTVKAGKHGSYEWTQNEEHLHGGPMVLEGTFVFETAAGKKIECTEGMSEKSHVLIAGKNAEKTPNWKINGCESEGQICETPFAPIAAQINNNYEWGERLENEQEEEEGAPTPGWTGKLGFLEGKGGASPIVGIAYTPKNGERLLVPIVCDGDIGTVWIGGYSKGGNTLLASLEPVDQMTTKFTERLKESAPGIQSPTHFQQHRTQTLDAFVENHWEPVALVATMTWEVEEGEEALEIKAKP